MSFVYPLGLIALVGIPVLILIYIIKNRYTEQIIPSTYIWTLSEKFLKRRVPISKLAGILSLILQILAVILIAFAIAQPVITVADSANSYCFVLDASGSMNITQNGETRFDIAKNEIADIIDKSMSGSEYTLIYAGNSTETIYEEVTDKKVAKQILSETEVNYNSADTADALKAAQEFFNTNPSVLTYLVTDQNYVLHANVNIINVAETADNYAISNVTYGISGGRLSVGGTVTSYESEKELTIELYFDGEDEVYASQPVDASVEGSTFGFLCNRVEFEYFRVVIKDADALALDNEVTVFNVTYENISNILLVSKSPFFMRAALISAGISKLDFITPDEYDNNEGYGLYIFDTFMPETLPDDGAVWFINPQSSIKGTNFTYQGEVEPRGVAQYSDAETETSTAKNLLSGATRREFELKKYVKCGMNLRFTPLITCDGNPLLFVGNNAHGNREVVFAFDLHDSAFALSVDFPALVKNFINYSFPTVIETTSYYVGDLAQINVVAGCNSIRIESPSGKTSYPDTSFAVCEYELTEVGAYNIVLVMKDKSERVLNVYAELPEDERIPVTLGTDFTIIGTPKDEKFDGYYDPLLILFIILAVVAVADYGVYCYEQYQLR